MFAEKLLEGIAAAGWVVGFVSVIGAIACLVLFLIALCKWAGEPEAPEEPVSKPEDEIPVDVFNTDTLPKYEYKEASK